MALLRAFFVFMWAFSIAYLTLPVSPAAAAPWWWAQFTIGDGTNTGNSGFERWHAFIAGSGNATTDTTFVCSYTWGTGGIGSIDGINTASSMGLNSHSAAGGVVDYLIADGDGGAGLTNATGLTDADVTDRTEAAGGSIMHIKDIFVYNKGYCISSANHTSGGWDSQHNNSIWFPWWAMSTGFRGKVSDQMHEMGLNNTFHDATQYSGGDVFSSPYGDTIELRFAPDDNDGSTAAGTGSIIARYRQLVAGARESIFFMSDAWWSSVGTDAMRDDIINRTGIIWRGCSGDPGASDWDAATVTAFEGDANGTLRNQPGGFNLLHSKTFIFDMDIVATGSANMSSAAMSAAGGNDESNIIVHDFRLARRFMSHYHHIMTNAGVTNDPSADAYDGTAPNGATGLTVTPGASSFTLNWTASTSTDVSRYYLFIDTAALTQNKIGDRVDDDADNYVDEDPRGDYDGINSGSSAPGTAADDDADGSADEDLWMAPEVQVKGKASTSGIISSYNVGDSLQAGVNYYFAVVSVDTQGNEGTIATAGPYQLAANVIVYNEGTLTDTTAAAGDTRILAQYVRVSGATPADTVTRFSVDYTGTLDSSSVTRVQLWADDGDSAWDSSDTYVAQLYWNSTSGWWDTTTISYKMGVSSATFLVTFDLAGSATPGSTFQSFIPVNGVKTSGRDTGPVATVTSGRTVTVTGAYSIVINEILADPLFGDINGDGIASTTTDEFIELYNYGGSSVDISGWALYRDAGQACTFPAGTIVPPREYVTLFPQDGDTTGYVVPGLVFAGNNGSFTLTNTSDSVTLYTAGLVQVDRKTWGGEANNNQSLVRNPESTGTGAWVQHTAADTADATANSPGVATWCAGVTVSGAVPTGFLSQTDTDEIVFIFRLIPDAGSDTLRAIAIGNTGGANNTDLLNVRLVRDNDRDSAYSTVADTVVATLTWSANAWRASGLAVSVPDSAAQFFILVNIDTAATIGDTVQLHVEPYSVAFGRTDSGPVSPVTGNPNVLSIKANTPVLNAVVNTDIYYAGLYAGDTGTELLCLNVSNSAGVADTLTRVTVHNAGFADSTSVAALKLWRDAVPAGRLGPEDTYVATLLFDGVDRWTSPLSLPMAASGATLLFTADVGGAPVLGDSVQLQAPLYGFESTGADSGPAITMVGNSMFQYVSQHSVLLSELEVDCLGVDPGGEFIEFYNPTGSPVALNGWTLNYHSSATNPFTNTAPVSLAAFTAVDSVPARGFFLIGGDSLPVNYGINANYLYNGSSLAGTAGHVVLRHSSGAIIDLVGYGTATWGEGNSMAPAPATGSSQVSERKAFDTSTAASMAAGDSRAGNAQDADTNSTDWVTVTANPQNAFSETEPVAAPLVIADTVPPPDLAGLSVIAGNASATLVWTATTEADSSQYRIYYDTQPITNVLAASVTLAGSLACNLGDTDYVVSGLTNGVGYYFAVTAVDTTGNQDTYPSVNVSCTPVAVLYTVRLTEVLADPPTGDDVNGDGIVSSSSDEFVEIWNYDSVPIDLSGCRLLNQQTVSSYTAMTFPANSIVPAYGYLAVFMSDSVAADNRNAPTPTVAGGLSISLTNGSDTVWLLTPSGDTLDSKAWGAEGNVNQSLHWTAAGWQQHEAADSVDCSSYSHGTNLVAVNGSIMTDIPAGFAEKGDTDSVLLAFRLYGNRGGDTLVNLRVANTGTALGADLRNVRLVRDWDADAAYDTPVGDSVIATLTWHAADTSWRAYGLTHALADTLNARFLVVADIDSAATTGRTLQLRLAPFGSRTTAADSGPMYPGDSNAAALLIKDPAPTVLAATDSNTYYAGLYAGDTGIPALAVAVSNSWGQADTITALTVQSAAPYSIDSRSITAVLVWENNGDRSRRDSSDLPLATLSPLPSGGWQGTGLSIALPAAGRHLLFTLTIAGTPVHGDSVMLQVPGYGIIAAGADSGPGTAVSNSMFQFVTRHSVLLSEFEMAGANGANDEYIECYNPSGTAVPLSGWKLLYASTGVNPFVASTSTLSALGPGAAIPARGFYLCGAATGFNGDTIAAADTTFVAGLSGTAGHLVLRDSSNVIIDLVGYGTATWGEGDSRAAVNTANSSVTTERKAADTSTAATMGTSDIRAGNGYDSDHSGFDWVLTTANPQNTLSDTEPRPWLYLTAALRGTVPDTTALTGATGVVALSVLLSGSAAGDTLTAFVLHNPGTALAADLAAVKLWRDVNADSQWDAGDLLVATLANAGDTWYAAGDTVLAGAGSAFLVTLDIAGGATGGRTFQAELPALRSDAWYHNDNGPADTVTNPGTITIGAVIPPPPHLLLSEVAYTGAEFIEVWNPNDTPVTLTGYFLSDDPLNYYKVTAGTHTPGTGDFIVRFPAGAVLGGQDTLVVCVSSDLFLATFPGVRPDYELVQDGNSDGVPDMLSYGVGGSAGLTNTSEPVILSYWDGTSDKVQDVDIVVWGAASAKYEFPNKTGVSIDSLYDGDSVSSAYAADDTSVASTAPATATASQSIRRTGIIETGEIAAGGNGTAGHDETSESMALTWALTTPSPWHTALVAYRLADYPFAYAVQSETRVEVLYLFLGGARGTTDTLTRLTVVNTGSLADTGVAAVKLWRDVNDDGRIDNGDALLGTLAWNGTAWETAAASVALPAGGDSFIIGIDISAVAVDYDTFLARVDTFALRAAVSDSASFTALAAGNAVMIASAASVQVYVPDVIATAALRAGDTNAVVAVIYLSTSLGWADTLTALTLRSSGSMNDTGVARLALWADNGDSLAGAGDTFIANFVRTASGWDTSGLAYPVAAGAATPFIVTFQAAAGAVHGDTLQLLVPAGGCTYATAFSGPGTADAVAYPLLFVETSPLVFSEVLYDPALAAQEFLELTALQALDPSGWRIRDFDVDIDWTIPDTCPTLLPGDRLVLRRGTGTVDIDRADGDVVFYLATFDLTNSGDPLALSDTAGLYRDFFTYEHITPPDNDLVAVAPYVYCGWPNDAVEPARGLTAAIGQALVLAGADADSSSTWTLSDTPTEGRVTLLAGQLPAADVFPGDTRAVLAFTVTGATFADTQEYLARFRVTNLGTLEETGVLAVALYRDNGDSQYGSGDTFVAQLVWDGSGWAATGALLPDLNRAGRLLVTVSIADTATHGGTFRANIPAYALATPYTESGPLTAVSNAAALTARTVYTVQVDTLVAVPAGGIAPGAADARVLALTITGHAQGDTLTVFALTNLGDAGTDTAVTAVRLWRDENANGSRDALDTFVVALQRSGAVWSAFIPAADSAALAGGGTAFIITVNIDSNAVLGETFQARVSATTVDAVRAETGPAAALTGSILTVSIATYSITGTAPLQAAPLDSGTRLYLYDLGGMLVDSYTIASGTGFFSLTAPDGTYYLYLVGPQHLATRVNSVVVSGSGTDLGTLPEQPAGDVNRDNRIDILDASYIRGALGSGNSVADLDHNGTVTSSDLSYIYSNYGRIGASSAP